MCSSGVSLPVPYFADLTISIAWCSVWFMGSFFKQCLHISLVDTIDRPSQVTLLVMRLQEMDINSFVNSVLWWLWNSNRPEDDASSLLIFRHVQVNSVAVSGHKTAWRYVSYIIHARSCTPKYSMRSFFIFLASAGDQIGTAESCLVQVPNISNDVIESSAWTSMWSDHSRKSVPFRFLSKWSSPRRILRSVPSIFVLQPLPFVRNMTGDLPWNSIFFDFFKDFFQQPNSSVSNIWALKAEGFAGSPAFALATHFLYLWAEQICSQLVGRDQ